MDLRQLRYFAPRVLGGPMPGLVEAKRASATTAARKVMDFSLFYFASEDESAAASATVP